ncbi:hypothetical protein DBV15_04661 [Temnothorax longispinosus]|uniref:Uncharacterized protein n=1 Tax=Temnothorax longispinosus TaxID=300112 RepID=A0A4S2JSX0_9HYME|nr:hypothetical protein DBV15_04661 [Temnothorax longispinosus]
MSSYWKLPPFGDGFWLADAATLLLFVAMLASRTSFHWYSMILALSPACIDNRSFDRLLKRRAYTFRLNTPLGIILLAMLRVGEDYTAEERWKGGIRPDNGILHRTIVNDSLAPRRRWQRHTSCYVGFCAYVLMLCILLCILAFCELGEANGMEAVVVFRLAFDDELEEPSLLKLILTPPVTPPLNVSYIKCACAPVAIQ